MDEIEYKLESTNPVLISHVSYSLFMQLNARVCHGAISTYFPAGDI